MKVRSSSRARTAAAGWSRCGGRSSTCWRTIQASFCSASRAARETLEPGVADERDIEDLVGVGMAAKVLDGRCRNQQRTDHDASGVSRRPYQALTASASAAFPGGNIAASSMSANASPPILDTLATVAEGRE